MARISILVHDINSPIVGAATSLAKHLATRYEVEVIGPDCGRGVCPMYRNTFSYKVISTPRLYRLPDYCWEMRKISRAVTGDLVLAVKAFAETVPLAWWHKAMHGRKAAVYLDEWDGSHIRMMTPEKRRRQIWRNLHHPGDDIYCPIIERIIPRLDTVLSTTTFLQKKFGGHIVHAGVDTEVFAPASEDVVRALKLKLNLPPGKNIVFGGVVRPHKGIELILDALVKIGNPVYRLLIVGPTNEHVKELLAVERYQPHLIALGARPKEEMPLYLNLADLMVLPLYDNLLAQSQMPCKVFEAMAMGKPVIGSAVSDLPLVLEGCGKVVPPDDVGALAEAIQGVFEDEELATEMGRKAREKCVREYSAGVTREKLLEIVGELIGE